MDSGETTKEKEREALLQETRKRLDELTILYEMTKISTSSLHLDQMLTEMMKSLHGFFKSEAFGIFLVDENTKALILHSSSVGLSAEDRQGPVAWVAEKGVPLLIDDVRRDSRFSGRDQRILSVMCVPLRVGAKITGVIDAQSGTFGAFSEEDLRLLQKTGDHLATIIENARSEERYRAVVESALDGVWVMGEDYRLTYVNERLVNLLGYSKDELIGMDFRHCLDEESKQVIAWRDAQGPKREETSRQYELNVLRKDGGVKNVEISSTVIRDPHGNANTVAFLKDITQKRKMEEQLLQAEKLRALGEMASGIAHDFNNALAIILGNAQLLIYNAQDEELKETLKTIENVARDSAQTVRRLLEFTRKGVHKELSEIDLNAVVREAVEATKPKWKGEVQGKGIQIEIALNLEEIPPVAGVVTEMREVVANMISNAVEAMPEGGRLEIRTFQKGKRICVQIADTGRGMTEEVKSKIFEPFFTTKPFSNTGLGLSMSYGIVRRVGGEIEVESRPGRGTTFCILLPVPSDGNEKVIDSPGGQKGRGARILVIDDEESVRSVLSKLLTKAEHRVVVAENGEEGVRLFRENEFDIVLTDLAMPGMSGWEVCQAIKEMSPKFPVGMMTGWGVQIDQDRMEESGLDFIVSKPFDDHQILQVVTRAIQSRGADSALPSIPDRPRDILSI